MGALMMDRARVPLSRAHAEEIRNAFARHQVRYLFLGTYAAILLGHPATTYDADLYLEKSAGNGDAAVAALQELGFSLREDQATRIRRGNYFIPLYDGPFQVDINFAPQGIESFEAAWARHVDVDGIPVCHPDDILGSKLAANRTKDREAARELTAFRDQWLAQPTHQHL
jgi:hypothetical protein